MMSRRMLIGSGIAVALGLVGTVAAWAVGPHGAGRHGMMKHVVSAMLDEALDEAQVTPEQRARVHAARDRAFTAVQTHMTSRRASMEDALQLFEADQVDPARLEALHVQRETEHRQVADVVTQAIVEVHDTLTAPQRKVVTDWVRRHH